MNNFKLDPFFVIGPVTSSKLLTTRYLSASSSSDREISKLHPQWVTGFVDGEGCFHVSITERKDRKLGWEVRLCFEIHLNEKDFALLEWIQNFFRVGTIVYKQKTKSIMFSVHSMRDLKIIIDHFDKYPLITQKRADYELFKQVFYLMLRGEHLTAPGGGRITKNCCNSCLDEPRSSPIAKTSSCLSRCSSCSKTKSKKSNQSKGFLLIGWIRICWRLFFSWHRKN